MHTLLLSLLALAAHHVPHPARALPAGVPEGYVLTRSGFFHPSCVYTLRDDEVWSPGVILGRDGSVHERVAPCAYPRFSTNGRIAVGGPRLGHPGGAADLSGPFGDYDGWLLYVLGGAATNKPVPVGATLSTTWIVPTLPTNVGFQDLAFFNGFELDAAHTDVIVQPVLDFSELPGQWGIESETCCFQNNDMQTALTKVSPGDTIRGTVVPQGCDATTKVCATIDITTSDLTTGESRTLTVTSHGLAIDEIDGAVFETYSVDSCDMLPASGEVVFDGVLKGDTGDTIPMAYTTGNCVSGSCFVANGNLANVPKTCSWDVTQAGSLFTLTFGSTPFVPDGGGSQFGLDLGMPDLAVPEDMTEPADLAVAPVKKKHGCDMAPLGGAPVRAPVVLVLLSFARLAARRRGASRSTRCCS